MVRSPSATLKPAKSMIASLGTGMQADSSAIRMKTAGSPVELMKSVPDVDDRVEEEVGDAGEEESMREAGIVGREPNSN